MPGKEVVANNHQSQQVPVSSRGRLEDLLNDLISMDETAGKPAEASKGSLPPAPTGNMLPASSEIGLAKGNPQSVNFAASHGKKQIPQALRAQLRLPAGAQGTYTALKNFHQINRHRPYVQLPCGLIAYVEYDVETERIRLFIGHKREFMIFTRGVKEQSAVLVIDEFFEYKVETQVTQILGFSKKEYIAQEKHKLGTELLRGNDLVAGKKVYPTLQFSLFDDKSCGISSCSVKAECVSR